MSALFIFYERKKISEYNDRTVEKSTVKNES